MTEYQDFFNIEEANRLFDTLEAMGFEYISTLSNVPEPGMFRVKWGKLEIDTSDEGVLADYERIYKKEEEEARAAHGKQCLAYARQIAAEQFAEKQEFESEKSREMFIAGFAGTPAKFADPRQFGLEPVFRAGRKAWASKEGQRQYRMAQVDAHRMDPYRAPERLPMRLILDNPSEGEK